MKEEVDVLDSPSLRSLWTYGNIGTGGGEGGGEEELGWTRRMSDIRCWASHLKSKTKQKERELVSPYLKTQSTVKVVSG